MPGIILGTPAYMSPEQARGRTLDRRTDVWSFGCVLYEMLTGKRAFEGEEVTDTLACIITKDPDWKALPEATPPSIQRLLRRCLQKDLRRRLRDIGDACIEIADMTAESPLPAVENSSLRSVHWWALALATLALAVGIGAFAALKVVRSAEPSFRLLTFQRGVVRSARFAPDGRTIVYSAAWNGNPSRVFMTRTDTTESSQLNLPAGDMVATTATGEIVLLAGRGATPADELADSGTLARASLMGGAARELVERVYDADVSADGSAFVIVRASGERQRLEFPIGTVLYETTGYISRPRLSPRGDRIAFLDHPVAGDDRGVVAIVDRAGNRKVLTREWIGEQGLAWSADGREVWFDAGPGEEPRAIYAVTLDGVLRLVYRAPMHLKLEDVSHDGRVLLSREDIRSDVMGVVAGDARERDLSWFYLQTASGLSRDGSTVVFSWLSGFDYASYMRKTDGSPAVRLGDGHAQDLSPDGKSVIAASFSVPNRFTVLPTGPGDVKIVALGSVRFDASAAAQFMPDGQRIVFGGIEPGHRIRSYVVPVAGGAPAAITPEGVVGTIVSPDGRLVIVRAADGRSALYDLTADRLRDLPGLLPGERVVRWDRTGHGLYVFRAGENPVRVFRLDVETGVRQMAFQLAHGDPAGTITGVLLTPDARTAVYTVHRRIADLYVATGLR